MTGPWPRLWRVPMQHVAAKAAATLVLAALAIALGLGGSAPGALLAAVAAVAAAGLTARDLLSPVRLTADETGLTIARGLTGRTHLPWPEITTIQVDVRPRLGLTTRLLEIDTGDRLYLLSAYDLGAPPDEVAAALTTHRPAP